mmetsp:Transcript_21188/g.42263  ORF Transcript_21188/g.42263 Transcript_21188/m.42263 type:complete len:222 (-) Transcript_21188:182-847(-)
MSLAFSSLSAASSSADAPPPPPGGGPGGAPGGGAPGGVGLVPRFFSDFSSFFLSFSIVSRSFAFSAPASVGEARPSPPPCACCRAARSLLFSFSNFFTSFLYSLSFILIAPSLPFPLLSIADLRSLTMSLREFLSFLSSWTSSSVAVPPISMLSPVAIPTQAPMRLFLEAKAWTGSRTLRRLKVLSMSKIRSSFSFILDVNVLRSTAVWALDICSSLAISP